MAIWIGDWFNQRKSLDEDGIVLLWGLWPGTDGDKPLAQRIQPDGQIDGPPWEWTGEIPPEHPDDVAADVAAAARR